MSSGAARPTLSTLVACLVVAGVLVAGAGPAAAATIQVTTTADEYAGGTGGQCSLREAVQAANTDQAFGGCVAGDGRDTIRVPQGTYLLDRDGGPEMELENLPQTRDLDITRRVSLVGAGRANTVIDGADLHRVIHIHDVAVAISRVTVTGGAAVNFGAGIKGSGPTPSLELVRSTVEENVSASTGGGIEINELRLVRSIVRQNASNNGGGIFMGSGDRLEVLRSVVSGNSADPGSGGGLSIAGGQDLTIANSRISGNTAVRDGGGIDLFGDSQQAENPADLDIVRTAVEGNRADSDMDGIGDGGGVRMRGSSFPTDAAVMLRGVTVAANVAENGDGIFLKTADLNAVNTTISNNGSTVGGGNGGGMYLDTGTAAFRSVTVAANAASSTGGGGNVYVLEGVYGFFNVAMGDDFGGGNCNVPVVSTPGTNIEEGAGAAPCGFATTDDLRLAPLADNGGPTQTRALLAGSPALGLGADCPGADQRGAPRGGGPCDAGAYERVLCRGVVVNRVGTGGRDLLTGTPGRDGFLLLAGRDEARGGGGRDGACGGRGADVLVGQGDDDRLVGGPGNDVMNGGPGFDLCVGGPGTDVARNCEDERSLA